MYKSKLQELCQRRSLGLPEYSSVKDGPDHMPRFTGTVPIQGQPFTTSKQFRSSKEAQNNAAKIAIDRLTAPISPPQPRENPLPQPRSPPPVVALAAQIPPLQGVVPVDFSAPVAQIPPLQGVVPDALAARVAQVPPLAAPVAQKPPLAAPMAQLQSPDGMPPIPPLPSSLPAPTPGLLMAKSANARPVVGDGEIVQQNGKDTARSSGVAVGSYDKPKKVTKHMYKNQLQQFAQKNNLTLPVYTCKHEGPPHDRRFKSSVTIADKLYETSDFFPTLKEAEQAAAKIACQMVVNVAPDVSIFMQHNIFFRKLPFLGLKTFSGWRWYKNLLQELAQKREMKLPTYETNSSGMPQCPLFVSTVEVGSRTFRGAEATTRKQAELNAAKAAYCAFMESGTSAEHSNATSVGEGDNFSRIIRPDAVMTNHQSPTAEENPVVSKRAKSTTETTDVNDSYLPGHPRPPEGSSVSIQSAEERVSMTVVFPRNSSVPLPEGAVLMPYSDEHWVAYTVYSEQEPTSHV